MSKRLKYLLFMIGDGDSNTAAWSKPDKSPRQLKSSSHDANLVASCLQANTAGDGDAQHGRLQNLQVLTVALR